MIKAIFTISGFAILAWIQVPIMIKKRWWRDLALYGIIFTLAFYYTLTYVLHWPFLDPIKIVTVLMHNIYRILGYEVVK